MSDLRYLIDYLAEENKTNVTIPRKKYVRFDANLIRSDFLYQADGNSIFTAIKDTYLISVALASSQSLWYRETTDDYVYYIKKIINNNGTTTEEFHVLNSAYFDNPECISLDEINDLSEIPLSYNQFEYITDTNTLYLVFEELDMVFLDGRNNNFYYTRASLAAIENGEYDLNYKDSLGLYDDVWDNLARNHSEKTLNRNQRKVTLDFNETITEGSVFKFPIISHVSSTTGRVTLDYNFDNGEPIIHSKIINTNYAFRIEFKSFQAFLSFCNQVYFSKGATFDLKIYPKVEKRFYEKYHEIVSDLIRESKRSSRPLANLIDIVWFLPQTYLQSSARFLPLLWDLMIEILEEDDVNNRGLNKEDLVSYIIINMSKILSPDQFLNQFLLTIVNKKDTPFKKLFEELQTDDFKTFVNVFWSVWSQSSYASFDPKKNPVLSENEEDTAPLVLPYTIDSTLGFYHSNAKIKFANDQTSIDVALSVNTGKTVTYGKRRRDQITVNVYNHYKYNYHVFHPVAIINEKAPKFLYDTNEGQQFTVLPAFVLLANEESAFWKNIQTGGEYLIDIVTTFSGVGNLAKFRHLKSIAKLGHKLTLAQKAKKAVTGVAAFVEISSGTINALLKLTGVNDTEFGQNVSEVLFYLELFALGGEITNFIGKRLAKASKALLDHPNFEKYLNKIEIDEITRIRFVDELKQIFKEYIENISMLRIIPDITSASEKALLKKLKKLFYKTYKIQLLKYQSIEKVIKKWKEIAELNALSKIEINELLSLRKLHKFAYNKNAASFVFKLKINGEVVNFELKALAGKKISSNELVTSANKNNLMEHLGFDEIKDLIDHFKAYNDEGKLINRFFDSEVKVLDTFDDAVKRLETKYGAEQVEVLGMEVKTLYEPCASCKKQIILRQQIYKMKEVKVKAAWNVKEGKFAQGNKDLIEMNLIK
ncbi:MAG: hypothetical protein AB8B65_19000 [Kordia sp.]|uniref:hypothetical protein n=1 Tax=Kordia sp. TaxID=1965332 RepID=UPI00385D5546